MTMEWQTGDRIKRRGGGGKRRYGFVIRYVSPSYVRVLCEDGAIRQLVARELEPDMRRKKRKQKPS